MTEYQVLELDGDNGYLEAGTFQAHDRAHASRQAAEKAAAESDAYTGGTFIAIPMSGYEPLTIKIERAPRASISGTPRV